MAATGFTPIILYHSTTASAVPTAVNLNNGELALNLTDGRLYYKDNSGTVKLIGANILPAVNGGTGQDQYTAGNILYASSTTALSKLAIGSANTVLTSSGSAPQWSADLNVTTLNTTGSVGVGTNTPSTKLQVAGTSGSPQFQAGTASNGYFQINAFDSNPVYCVIAGANATLGVIGTQSNIPFVFFTNNAERARFSATGLFGIGTTSPSALLTLAAGTATANTGPLKFTSGTNLGTPEAGAVEYDGTVMTATSNTNFNRGTIPLTNYASGTGTTLTTNGEATLQNLLPAANDTITLSSGTYFLDISFIITRGATSTTSATARLNILGTGNAAGNFSGMSLSAPTAGGATANFAFDAVNINVSNVLTAASATAAGVYTMTLRGLLKITTGGTIIPQYNLSANINASGTVAKVLYLRLQQIDSQNAAAFGPAGTGWA